MRRKNGLLKNKYSFRPVLVIFFIVCVIASVFSYQYYDQLQGALRDESRGYLQEISRRTGEGVNRIIEDNYGALSMLASVLSSFDVDAFHQISPLVSEQKERSEYEEIFLIDESGKGYNTEGKELFLYNDDYFTDVVVHKQNSISTIQMIDNQECIMLAVPLNDLVIGGKKMVALAANYLPDVFEQTLSMSSFDGRAYSCIINKNGAMVVRPTISDTIQFGYNVLTTLSACEMDEGSSIAHVQEDMTSNNGGQIGFTQSGTRYYLVYTPVNPESWYLLTFVPATVVNERSDMLLNLTLVFCGIVTVVFACLLAALVWVFSQNKQKLEHLAYVDDVTGGNTIQRFHELAGEALQEENHPVYALVYTNLQKFKLLNEQFGRDACDELLRAFYEIVCKDLRDKECIGRISADNFCMLLRYQNEEELLKRFDSWQRAGIEYILETKPLWTLPVTEFGVFILREQSVPFPQMIDRAKLAIREFPRFVTNKLHFAVYNDKAHQKLFREKHLEDIMEDALKNGEFQVYLQPKYFLAEKRIGGAEALARWQSASEGMIYPNEFIPLFEKNGFVIQLDLYIFEEVCKRMRSWLDQGRELIKVSVNCSRVQLNKVNFLDSYVEIAKRYDIPPQWIEIELTESVVMEDVQRLTKVIEDIHEIGFGCSMDDFGSGYSSLNLIQTIPVDTLKLDRIFFHEHNTKDRRTEHVVGSIVTMAKALSMATVAEGIEHEDQVEMLNRVGCDYVQGYVYAKPMPIDEFEKLAFHLTEK